MPSHGRTSKRRLDGCSDPVKRVMTEVVKTFDNSILTGIRDKEEQEAAFNSVPQASKKHWPDSVHNVEEPGDLSDAVDAAPYPIDWEDRERFHYFAGYVLATARAMGYVFRWGGDWDRDTEVNDNEFDDLVHFEYVGNV
ncbi:MAG: M15 family peptidase [Deltaproteobacteria bacterium]|nr:M15 family peptidase [Deltaproteobacteria bacterium]